MCMKRRMLIVEYKIVPNRCNYTFDQQLVGIEFNALIIFPILTQFSTNILYLHLIQELGQ